MDEEILPNRKNFVIVSGEVDEPKAKKCKSDEILYRGHCLKKVYLGDNCVAKDQCQNGAHCIRGTCRCKPNAAAYRLMCVENICGGNQFRLPELDANNNAIMCAEDSRICTAPHKCIFSKIIDDYICCKSVNKQLMMTSNTEDAFFTSTHRPRHTTISRQRRQCPNNEKPLMFPGTNQPVKCTSLRACPGGYSCANNVCCKETVDSTIIESEDES
jgi:hypothetical protein